MENYVIRTCEDDFISEPYLTQNCFTDAARRLFDHVRSRSVSRRLYGSVPPLIVLWSMLRWEPKLGTRIIENCGADLWSLERDVDLQLKNAALLPEKGAMLDDSRERFYLDFSAVGKVAQGAVSESEKYGDPFVSTEHIALTLGSDNANPDVLRVLRKHGVSYEMMRRNLEELRS